MRSLSNLLKSFTFTVKDEETRVIDNNELVKRRIEEHEARNAYYEQQDEYEYDPDDFEEGVDAEQIDGLLGEDDETALLKAQSRKEAKEAEQMRMQAQEELEQAQMQVQQMLEEAQMQTQQMMEQAREQGYQEGLNQARQEVEAEFVERQNQLNMLEADLMNRYEANLREIEPMLVEKLTQIYELVFDVELSSHKEMILSLIEKCIYGVESSSSYLIHVSKQDYAVVSEAKEMLREKISSPNATVDIVEDTLMASGQCVVETDNGIFDCGLGTQLAELGSRLRMISYDGNV